MAQTKEGKKIIPVDGYTKKDGTEVPPHRRSTPNNCNICPVTKKKKK